MKINYQMSLLSCFGIIFVVLGHINPVAYHSAIGTFYGWLPYYSFHLAIFLFVTGYFFKESSEEKVCSFCLKKIKNLLIPYYFINGGFLIFQTIIRRYGFEIGEIFSLKTWILSPWIHIQPSTFSIPTWYLPALFIAEIYFIIIRKIVKKL